MDSQILPWVLFTVAIVAVFLLSILFVRFLHHKLEDEYLFVTFVCGAAVFLILLLLAVIPVDIYSVSSTRDSHGSARLSPSAIAARMNGVRDFYYVIFGSVLFFAFIALPFVFFFQEERDPDTPDCTRVFETCKFSVVLVVVLVILLVVGGVVTGSSAPTDPTVHDTFAALLATETKGEASLGFAVMCLAVLGALALVSYTATGFAAMPISMVKPSTMVTGLDREDERVTQALLSTKDRQWEIDAKAKGGRRITKKEAEARKTLARSRRQLERRQARVQREKTSCWRRTLVCLRPFEVIFGVVFAILSLFLIIALTLSLVDRARNSTCGYDCGFLLLRPSVPNPYDMLMVTLSRLFPLDYVFMLATTLFVFAATTGALLKIHVRLACCIVARVRRRRTSSQGLVLAVYVMLLALVGFMGLFCTLAPTYASYGSQVYVDATGATKPCSLEAPPAAGCTMTELATFFTRLAIKFPAVGTYFFAMTFVFVAVYLVALLVSFLVTERVSNSESSDSDDFV